MQYKPIPACVIGEGFSSIVYMTDDGNILRAAKNAFTQRKRRQEVLLLQALQPYIHSVAIPQPSLFIEPNEQFPFGAVGYRQIPGRPLRLDDLSPAMRQPIATHLASFINELHRVPLDVLGRQIQLPSYLPAPQEQGRLWNVTIAYLRLHAPTLISEAERAYTTSLADIAEQPSLPVLIHGDLWYENIIVDRDQIVGIVDFEVVSSGPPIVDFMTQGYVDDDFRRLVVEKYQRFGHFTYDERLGRGLILLRELNGLDYGIRTGTIDEDALEKIAQAAQLILGHPTR